MAMGRGEIALRHVCTRFVKDARRGELGGQATPRAEAIKRVEDYRALLRLKHPRAELPVALRVTVADLRKTAVNPSVLPITRAQAIARLMIVQGHDIEIWWKKENVDELIESVLGRKLPEPVERKTRRETERLAGTRQSALFDIRNALRRDLAEGRLDDVPRDQIADALRLPEQEPVGKVRPVSLSELHREELDAVLKSIGGTNGTE